MRTWLLFTLFFSVLSAGCLPLKSWEREERTSEGLPDSSSAEVHLSERGPPEHQGVDEVPKESPSAERGTPEPPFPEERPPEPPPEVVIEPQVANFPAFATCSPSCPAKHVCEDVPGQSLGRCVPLPPREAGPRQHGEDCSSEESKTQCDGSKDLVCHALRCKKTCLPYAASSSCASGERCVALTFLSPTGGVCLPHDFFSPALQGSCGLSQRGEISCWGPHFGCREVPPPPMPPWPDPTICDMKPTPHPHASAFASMSPFGPLCGLISDGKVWCKGSYGDPTLYKPPLLEGYPEFSETWRLFHSSEKITQIASGSGYVFALSETGRVGSLPIFFGYGYKTPQNQFYWNNSFRHVIQIASCGLSVCALLRDGTVRCTSQDSPPQAAPAASPLPGMERIVSINCSYGLRADGRAFSWEYPHSKWLSELTQIRQLVSAGGVFCALVVGSSAVLCWDPSPTSYSIALGRGRIHAASEEELNALKVPAPVVGLSGVVSLSLGRSALYAKTADGAWWGWGENSEGRLGDGTRERRYTPVKLLFQP